MKAPTCLSYLGNGLADAILLTLSSLCPRALRRHNNIVTMREEGWFEKESKDCPSRELDSHFFLRLWGEIDLAASNLRES